MLIITLSIKKVTMTDNQIDYWITLYPPRLVFGRIFRVSTKNVKNLPSVMIPCRDITIGVIILISSWICQSLYLIALGVFNKAEIRINISTCPFEMTTNF